MDIGVDFAALACQFFVQFITDFYINCAAERRELEIDIRELGRRIRTEIGVCLQHPARNVCCQAHSAAEKGFLLR